MSKTTLRSVIGELVALSRSFTVLTVLTSEEELKKLQTFKCVAPFLTCVIDILHEVSYRSMNCSTTEAGTAAIGSLPT